MSTALLACSVACNRASDDDPPPIKLPGTEGRAQETKTGSATSTSAPATVALLATTIPNPPGRPTTRVLASTPEGQSIVITPFTIQIPTALPMGFPTALPSLPPIPTIPGIPPLFASPTSSAAPSAPVQPQSDDRVIVYGATWCGACRSLKQDLDARHVPYTFVNIEDSHAMATPAGNARRRDAPGDAGLDSGDARRSKERPAPLGRGCGCSAGSEGRRRRSHRARVSWDLSGRTLCVGPRRAGSLPPA